MTAPLSAPLVATSSQTVGPFFHFGLTTNEALGVMIGPDTPGDRIAVRIRIIDGAGAAVPDALVELWQANAAGTYVQAPDHANSAPGQSFRGWGRLPTSADGSCEFQTIRPGRVRADDGQLQASHINICVFMRGLLRHLFTRVYFDGDPDLTDDGAWRVVPAERRHTLLARRAGSLRWDFDIHLQGEHETVFFNI
jgi:protocatechuate 3,4-dioxygenase, alpha subunit